MKAFDLARALAGDPVVTRDNRKVLEVHYMKHADHEDRVCLAVVIEGDKHGIMSYYKNGKYIRGTALGRSDLFMAPVMRYSIMGLCDMRPFPMSTHTSRELAEKELKSLSKKFSTHQQVLGIYEYPI